MKIEWQHEDETHEDMEYYTTTIDGLEIRISVLSEDCYEWVTNGTGSRFGQGEETTLEGAMDESMSFVRLQSIEGIS